VTDPAPAFGKIDRTREETLASVPPEVTVNTVRASAPIAFTNPFANVSDAESVQDVATPTPAAAAAEVGAARRD